MLVRALLLMLILHVLTPAAGAQAPPAAGSRATASPIAGARSWGYQLQHGEPDVIAASPYDLVVVDYSRWGTDDGRFSPDDVRRMQMKPDGSRRYVLAYLSIGEAESYRFYWNDDWVETLAVTAIGEDSEARRIAAAGKPRKLRIPRLSAPIWLGRENENWEGNYLVRYWEKGWQDIIFGSRTAYLERIVAAGFDGVYLDRVDAYYGVTDERASGKADMIRFVSAISQHAKALKPGFAIVPQNGEELLLEPAYLAAIDGVAKEDLLYGHPTEGQPNAAAGIETSVRWLSPARRLNLPVLVVEYTLDKRIADRITQELTPLGFIPYFGVRSLDRLVVPDDLRTGAKPPAPPAGAGKGANSTRPATQLERRRQKR